MERYLFRKLVVIALFIIIFNISCFASPDTKDDDKIVFNGSVEEYYLENMLIITREDLSSDLALVSEEIDRKKIFPMIHNQYVEAEILYLTSLKRDFMERSIGKAGKYTVEMRKIFKAYNLPEELVYLPIIESGFNYHAYSRKGAAGMWQFMPATAMWIGMKRNDWVDERLDPLISCEFAAKYLSSLYDLYQDWYLALAAYNYGRGNVSKAIKRAGASDYYTIHEKGGIPDETKKYVPRFKAVVEILSNPEKYDFTFVEEDKGYDYVVLPFISPIHLVARYSGLTLSQFNDYNPALRSSFIPGGAASYRIRLPKNNAQELTNNISKLKEHSYAGYKVYYVQKGDSLSGIASGLGISLSQIMVLNNISNSNRIWEGQKLFIPSHTKISYNSKTVHQVNHGETVSEIALKYGVSADIIARLNNLDANYCIRIGQILKIR